MTGPVSPGREFVNLQITTSLPRLPLYTYNRGSPSKSRIPFSQIRTVQVPVGSREGLPPITIRILLPARLPILLDVFPPLPPHRHAYQREQLFRGDQFPPGRKRRPAYRRRRHSSPLIGPLTELVTERPPVVEDADDPQHVALGERELVGVAWRVRPDDRDFRVGVEEVGGVVVWEAW